MDKKAQTRFIILFFVILVLLLVFVLAGNILSGEKDEVKSLINYNNISFVDYKPSKLDVGEIFYGKEFVDNGRYIISSDILYSAQWYPDNNPKKDFKKLVVELQVTDKIAGENFSIRGTADIPKYYSGHFDFNTSSDKIVVFRDGLEPKFTWEYSKDYITSERELKNNLDKNKINENKNKKSIILEKEVKNITILKENIFYNYTKIDKDSELIPKGLFLDPDISACGTLNISNTVYSITNDLIVSDYTGGFLIPCLIIEASNITINGNGNSIIYNGTEFFEDFVGFCLNRLSPIFIDGDLSEGNITISNLNILLNLSSVDVSTCNENAVTITYMYFGEVDGGLISDINIETIPNNQINYTSINGMHIGFSNANFTNININEPSYGTADSYDYLLEISGSNNTFSNINITFKENLIEEHNYYAIKLAGLNNTFENMRIIGEDGIMITQGERDIGSEHTFYNCLFNNSGGSYLNLWRDCSGEITNCTEIDSICENWYEGDFDSCCSSYSCTNSGGTCTGTASYNCSKISENTCEGDGGCCLSYGCSSDEGVSCNSSLVGNTPSCSSFECELESPSCSFFYPTINWNTTKQSGTRVFSNGTQIGGNFWTNSTGGISTFCTDSNTDGFCDLIFDVFNNNFTSNCTSNNCDFLAYSNVYEEVAIQWLNSSITDSMNITDLKSINNIYKKLLFQDSSLSDIFKKISSLFRTSNQGITESDLISRFISIIRISTNQITFSDIISSLRNLFRTSNQEISYYNLTTSLRDYFRSTNQDINENDIISYLKSLNREATQSISYSDLSIMLGEYFRANNQDINILEIMSYLREVDRGINQEISSYNIIGIFQNLFKTSNQEISYSDSSEGWASGISIIKIFQGIDISDIISSIRNFFRNPNQEITYSDLSIVLREYFRSTNQDINENDIISYLKSLNRETTQSITYSDLTTALRNYFRTTNQDIDESDLTTALRNYFRTSNQEINESELIVIRNSLKIFTTNRIELSDIALSLRYSFREANQNISFSDYILMSRGFDIININQEITIYESISKNNIFIRTISQILGIFDGGFAKVWIGVIYPFGSGDISPTCIIGGSGDRPGEEQICMISDKDIFTLDIAGLIWIFFGMFLAFLFRKKENKKEKKKDIKKKIISQS